MLVGNSGRLLISYWGKPQLRAWRVCVCLRQGGVILVGELSGSGKLSETDSLCFKGKWQT